MRAIVNKRENKIKQDLFALFTNSFIPVVSFVTKNNAYAYCSCCYTFSYHKSKQMAASMINCTASLLYSIIHCLSLGLHMQLRPLQALIIYRASHLQTPDMRKCFQNRFQGCCPHSVCLSSVTAAANTKRSLLDVLDTFFAKCQTSPVCPQLAVGML